MTDNQLTHPHPLLVPLMAGGLSNLSDGELAELDKIITPRAAQLMGKAFGADIYQILNPLIADEINTPPSVPAEQQQKISNDVQKLMRDPRYWQNKDPKIIKKVAEGFAQLHPNR